jgi:hypothetical protein
MVFGGLHRHPAIQTRALTVEQRQKPKIIRGVFELVSTGGNKNVTHK